MANVIVTPRLIVNQVIAEFENKIKFGAAVYRDLESKFGPDQSGRTVSLRRPLDFTVQQGPTATKQDIVDATATLTVDQNPLIMTGMTVLEQTMDERLLADRITSPIAHRLAVAMDSAVPSCYWQIPNFVGTPAAPVNTYAGFIAPVTRLTELGVSDDNRRAALTPKDYSALAVNNSSLFSDGAVDPALRDRNVKRLADTDVWESILLVRHTVGNYAGTGLVNGASQAVTYQQGTVNETYQSTLNTDGWTASRTGLLKRGDIISIAGVNWVNYETKADTGIPAQFTVMADVNSDGSGNAALTISPPLVAAAGAQQIVTAAPADNAAITVVGTPNQVIPQNIMFHRDAIALACIPLAKPVGAPWTERADRNGYSILATGQYDINNGASLARWEMAFGVKVINPRMAIRFSGA